MKIVITDGYACSPDRSGWRAYESLGQVAYYDRTVPEQLLPRIREADIICTNKVLLTREIMEQCPSLKLICVMATGYNVVDVAAARELGVSVCNIPAYSTEAVTQMTMALLLELTNHVALHSESVHRGDWAACPDFCYWKKPLTELAGRTLGIIGYGKIGRSVGKAAEAFGMKVLWYSRHYDGGLETENSRYAPLDELLQKSHVVSLHCPQTPETEKLINRERLGLMRPGALLLNTARGGLLDEAAVAEALGSGQLGGAAVDVVSQEPILPDNPLLSAPNCIITPHIAWAPEETRARLLAIGYENIRAFLEGRPQNLVS